MSCKKKKEKKDKYTNEITNVCGQVVGDNSNNNIKNHKIITLETMPIESMAIRNEPVVNSRKIKSRNSKPKIEFSLPYNSTKMRRSKSKCEMKCDLFSIFLYSYMEHYGSMEMAVKLANDMKKSAF